jgi:hypothetical protein
MRMYRMRWSLEEITLSLAKFRGPHEQNEDTELGWAALTEETENILRRAPYPIGPLSCQWSWSRTFFTSAEMTPSVAAPLLRHGLSLTVLGARSDRASVGHGPAGNGRADNLADQARILAFSRANSSAEMTPRSRRSASLANWSAELSGPAASLT